jgi:hypothetical protein
MTNRPERGVEKTSLAQRESAEALAVEALSFLAADPGRLGRFLALSGIGPDVIRQAATESGFLAGVLQHINSDERLLLEFAAHADIKPAAVMRAAATLGGPEWEREVP